MELFHPIFQWADDSGLGAYIRDRTWPFPLIETIHIMALAVFLGALFLIDLRLMGLKMGGIAASRLTRELNRYIDWGIALILITGVMLFASEGGKLYENAAFAPKMIMLGAALLFHYTIHRRAVANDKPPAWAAFAGLISQALWIGVGAAGRAIGFV
ncbi:MAG: DUF6644 family protein [Acidobacteriota bacterium]